MPDQPKDIQIPLAWVGLEDLPIMYANEVMVQQQPGEVVVTFGQIQFPAFATPEDMAGIEYVPVRPLIRLGIAPDKFRDIAVAMQAALDKRTRLEEDLDPR